MQNLPHAAADQLASGRRPSQAGKRAELLSVVIPCHNEEATLDECHRRVSAAAASTGLEYEIVFVNDGSRDGTWARLSQLADCDPRVVAVNLSRNFGHQLALSAGLTVCGGSAILILDCDLQDPPELLAEMLPMLIAGADVVYGQRRRREGESWLKRATAVCFYRLFNRLSDIPVPADTGDFRLMTRRVLDVLLKMPERHRFLRGMVSWVGFHQVAIVYDREPRRAGTTSYSLAKMLTFAGDALTAFSLRPLRWASWSGLLAFAAGLVASLRGVAMYLDGNQHIWAVATTAVVLLVGGMQLLALGAIGEYLGRLYHQSLGRPLFVIEEIRRSTHADLVINSAAEMGRT